MIQNAVLAAECKLKGTEDDVPDPMARSTVDAGDCDMGIPLSDGYAVVTSSDV